jgi:hypothetical protein
MHYFGERENGPPIQDREAITATAWQGIVGLIESSLRTAMFAEDFPDRSCQDEGRNETITGCNERQFYLRLAGDHPEIPLPLDPNNLPDTVAALELLEFCYRHASEPVGSEPHAYFAHRHYLHFSRDAGQTAFARDANSILTRNRLGYELQGNGEIRRLLPLVLREVLVSAQFTSEDPDLNRLLESARDKVTRPDFRTRYDALRDLWDAFERLKTLEEPRNNLALSSAALIARVSQEPQIRAMLDLEMRQNLPALGNGFFIRHANANQVNLQTSEEIDYLFHRLFAVIRLLLRSTGRAQ